jgi:flotillin
MLGWRVPNPGEVMLVSGGKHKSKVDNGALPFRIVTGHGAFVVPLFRQASFLGLSMQEAEIAEDCVTTQGLRVSVKAVIAFKVGSTDDAIVAAAQRFLSDQRAMPNLVGQIFAGHLRAVVGALTIEAAIKEQQSLATKVLEASKVELGRLGLVIDSFQIQSIDDKGSGYIDAMAAPHKAAVNQAAKIAQAAADQAAAEAEQQSRRAQAQFERDTAVARAQYKAETDAADSKAAQQGPLAAAQAQQEVLAEQAKVAERNAELRAQELIAEVIKPAEANAERIRITAEANAKSVTLSAEAAATQGKIALDQRLIDQLPELVRAAAEGMANANVTILNGATGYTESLSGIAGTAMGVLNTLRDGIGSGHAAQLQLDGEYEEPADEAEAVEEVEAEPEPPAPVAPRRRTPRASA